MHSVFASKDLFIHCFSFLSVYQILNTLWPVSKTWQQFSLSLLLCKVQQFQPARQWQPLLQQMDTYLKQQHGKLQLAQTEYYMKIFYFCCKYPNLGQDVVGSLCAEFHALAQGKVPTNSLRKKECLLELLMQFEEPNEAMIANWKRESVQQSKKKKKQSLGIRSLLKKITCCLFATEETEDFIPYEKISWKFLLQCLGNSFQFYKYHLPQKPLKITAKLTGNSVNRIKNDLSHYYRLFYKTNLHQSWMQLEILEKDEACELIDNICNVEIEFYNSDITFLCVDFSKDASKLKEQILDCQSMTDRINPKLILLTYKFSKLSQDSKQSQLILNLCQQYSIQIFCMEELLQEREPILFEYIFQSNLLHLNKLI